jgi:hypothetical protein
MTARRIAAGMSRLTPTSSGRLGPPPAGRRAADAEERGEPARAGQEADRLADDRLLEGVPCPAGVLAGRALASFVAIVVVAELVELDAQLDQVIQGGRVDLAGDHWRDRRVAGERAGGVAVQPGAAVAAAHRRGRAARGPGRPRRGDPLLHQRGTAV